MPETHGVIWITSLLAGDELAYTNDILVVYDIFVQNNGSWSQLSVTM